MTNKLPEMPSGSNEITIILPSFPLPDQQFTISGVNANTKLSNIQHWSIETIGETIIAKSKAKGTRLPLTLLDKIKQFFGLKVQIKYKEISYDK